MKTLAALLATADPDVDALREKYAQERRRRLNPRGTGQFVQPTGELVHYSEDPYIEAPLVRDPVHETVDAVIMGAGFGGLLAAGTLKKAGVSKLRIIEKAGDVGGTWY